MGNLPFIAVATVLGLYGAWVTYLYFRQRSLQYRPTHRDALGVGNRVFKPWVDSEHGFQGYVRQHADPRRVVVFFHGSQGEALDRQWVGQAVSGRDLLVLVEYPGYGARRGRATQSTLLGAGRKVIQALKERWPDRRLVAVGEGLGAAVAARLGAEALVDEIGMIAPFRSSEDVAARRYPLVPVKWFLKDRFCTLHWVAQAKVPLHIVHGTLDERVPFDHGRDIFEAATGAAQRAFDEVPGFGNTNLDQAILHSPFTVRFREFLAG